MAAGKEIKRLRGNISTQKVADLIGVSVEKLRKWEQRDSDPKDINDIRQVEWYFGCKLEDLTNLDNFSFVQKEKPIEEREAEPEIDYKKEYITLLREHLDIKKALLGELDLIKKDIEDFKESHRLTSEELNGLRHSLQVNLSVQLAFQDYWLHYFHKDRQQLAQAKKSIQRATVEFLAGMKQGGIEKAVGIESEDDSGRKKS